MKQRNSKLLFISIVALGVLSSPGFARSAEAATIRSISTVNFRERGSVNAPRLDHLANGEKATVLDLSGEWYHVRIGSVEGYTHSAYWTLDTVTAVETASLRSGPDQQSPAILNILPDTVAGVLGRSGEWILVETNGISGYSHWTYWDLPTAIFEMVPETSTEATLKKPKAASTEKSDEPLIQGRVLLDQKVVLNEEIPGYSNAADALSGENSLGLQGKGEYTLTQIEGDMYHLSDGKEEEAEEAAEKVEEAEEAVETVAEEVEVAAAAEKEGFWIDSNYLVQKAGDQYTLLTDVPGHMNAMAAKKGEDQVVTVGRGVYNIYRIYGGMYNVTTSKESPGAWIDPRRNKAEVLAEVLAEVPIGDQVVSKAMELIGAPYILGAESWDEGGFDCSGLTYYSFGELGYELPRCASQQWAGIETKVTDPRPGDIIAFEKDGEVYHVGLYIGNRQMIHSPKPGSFVKISDLSWWYENSRIKGFLRPYSDNP